MVCVALESLGYARKQAQLHFQRILAGREPGAVGDAKDVRIDGHGGRAEGHIHDDVRCFASHTREALELRRHGIANVRPLLGGLEGWRGLPAP